MKQQAQLVLATGEVYQGFSFGAPLPTTGEVVFNTSMVGYPESLTDPSYRGQILVLTYPLVGNYGVPAPRADELGIDLHFESKPIQVAGLIIADYSEQYHHWNSEHSLGAWLTQEKIPALYGVDTRMLTQKIRESGALLGKMVIAPEAHATLPFTDPLERNLVAEVSCQKAQEYGNGKRKVVVVDCGIKNNIIRHLVQLGLTVKVVPWDYDFNQEEWDGLFVSNGPGDPNRCAITIENLRRALLRKKPIFGICLGHQLLALVAGARTYKLKFGHRGQNQPCRDLTTGRCYITPQNHGFAVERESLPAGWSVYFENINDGSIEGIYHQELPYFSVQFHPEAKGGPTDTEFLFQRFFNFLQGNSQPSILQRPSSDRRIHPRSVLILGSGGLSIGQAGEFDYSGSQAIKALKEEGIRTILINPNIATIQTSENFADEVYFLPVSPEVVEKVIAKERPEGILLSFGGQTALNCGVELFRRGVFENYQVQVLGTPVQTIIETEDRQQFADRLNEIQVQMAPSVAAYSVSEALAAAAEIGYPVILRAAYALGGLGSGFASNPPELAQLATTAFSQSNQVLVEKSLKGWKEIEYEVVRDAYDNCITVCNMENFDPLGIHTGDSIVVAPSQTLSNEEYQKLRSIAIKTIRHLGIVGECNIQYALDTTSENYYVIEVNARLSRSSALASKATGYPLAFVAAKLALGYDLGSLKNIMTHTTACFEPSLDYVVVKVPRWDLKKFDFVSHQLGSSMKSVGEVMAIGRTFQEALMKGLRMANPSYRGPWSVPLARPLEEELAVPSDSRVYAIYQALLQGRSVDELYQLTQVDKWFLYKFQEIVQFQQRFSLLSPGMLAEGKKLGFSDLDLARMIHVSEEQIRKLRHDYQIHPVIKQIDTTAAEYPAQSNYLYFTYHGVKDDVDFLSNNVVVLGSGAYRIGSSVEFDWCAVNCVKALKKMHYTTTMINYNPETVSTDFDECDYLIFDEINLETILEFQRKANPLGFIVSVGGQISNNLAHALGEAQVKIFGTSPVDIDRAENRYLFSQLLDDLKVDQPIWQELKTLAEIDQFVSEVGFPVLVRPSYVLSGQAMEVAMQREDLLHFLKNATEVSPDHPVVVSKFITGAKEIEVDAVAQNGEIIIYALSEHVENAGVHSGDATLVLPAQKLYIETIRRIKKITRQIARSLKITGPFNIQYIAKNNEIKVIECNLRASRSFPFASKVYNINFIELATYAMMGRPCKIVNKSFFDLDYVGIKAPQFSFTRLHGADPVLGVEMASTGEVASFGDDIYEAFLNSLCSTGFQIPKKHILLSTGNDKNKIDFLDSAVKLVKMGFILYASHGTHRFLAEHGIKSFELYWPLEEQEANIRTYLIEKRIDLVINIPKNDEKSELRNGYQIRRLSVDHGIPLITNIQCANLLVDSLFRKTPIRIKSWRDFLDAGENDGRSGRRTVSVAGPGR